MAFASPHVFVRCWLVLARVEAEADAIRLSDGGRGSEGSGAVPGDERRSIRLLRRARRRGSRLRMLDVCQRQSKVPLESTCLVFHAWYLFSHLPLVLTLGTYGEQQLDDLFNRDLCS